MNAIRVVHLDPDVSALGPEECAALDHLLAMGTSAQEFFESQLHPQALAARRRLMTLHTQLGRPEWTRDLIELYRRSSGPIATTLRNEPEAFLPVDGWSPGHGHYPPHVEGAEIEAFLARRPDRRSDILDPRTVVRRTTPATLRRDLATLRRYPALAALHPGLVERLGMLSAMPDDEPFYAVPYSVSAPEMLLTMSARLWAAASAVAPADRDLAAYLRLRSHDMLTDEIEGGSAAWIRGDFPSLDVVVAAEEIYADELFGVKTSLSATILLRDDEATDEIRGWMAHLAEMDAELPYEGRRREVTVRVGSYNLLAAFGSSRFAGAEILPDDPDLIRKYGRRILFRRNIIFEEGRNRAFAERWASVVVPGQGGDLTARGSYVKIVGHELGHYVGPDHDLQGRTFDATLGEHRALVEELKADVFAALFADRLTQVGALTEAERRGANATAVLFGLLSNPPKRGQIYDVIGLIQLNWLRNAGVVSLRSGQIELDYGTYVAAALDLLREVLSLQERGTRATAAAFIERWTAWDDGNEAIARSVGPLGRRFFYFAESTLEPARGN